MFVRFCNYNVGWLNGHRTRETLWFEVCLLGSSWFDYIVQAWERPGWRDDYRWRRLSGLGVCSCSGCDLGQRGATESSWHCGTLFWAATKAASRFCGKPHLRDQSFKQPAECVLWPVVLFFGGIFGRGWKDEENSDDKCHKNPTTCPSLVLTDFVKDGRLQRDHLKVKDVKADRIQSNP